MTDTLTLQIHARLAATAEHLRQKSGLSDHELATAFLAVASTLAVEAHGPVNAAEWLRDIADGIERDGLAMPRPGAVS